MNASSFRSVLVCLGCYATIGSAGYVNFPASTEPNVLSNYRLDDPRSRLMAPFFDAIALAVLMAYPLCIFPCRYMVDAVLLRLASRWAGTPPLPSPPSPHAQQRLARERIAPPMPVGRRVVLTAGLPGFALLIAFFMPGINIVFQLMGGTASAFVCFILPAAFALHYELPEVRTASGRLCCIVLFLFGIIVSVLSTAVTLAEIFAHSDAGAGAPSHGAGRDRL